MASKAKGFGWLAVLVWIFCAVPLTAQSRVSLRTLESMPAKSAVETFAGSAPATADAVIAQMARSAGTIFAGQVMAIRRPVGFAGSGEDAAESAVEVDFRVDQAVRGPAVGFVYTLREWPGLWNGGSRRYRIGQRLLVFLYAPNTYGFSSPVHGAEGLIPVRGGGYAPGPDNAHTDVAEWNVDLRWVRAQVQREQRRLTLPVRDPVYPIKHRPSRGSTPEFDDGLDEDESIRVLSRRLPEPSVLSAQTPDETEPLSQVIALCLHATQEDVMRHRDGIR